MRGYGCLPLLRRPFSEVLVNFWESVLYTVGVEELHGADFIDTVSFDDLSVSPGGGIER